MLIVFDLDLTLWNCAGTWCDATTPPYRKKNNRIYDSQGDEMKLYPDTKAILESLKDNNYSLAIASRTGAPDWANQLLLLHDLNDFFDHKEIYPGSKTTHFTRLRNKTQAEYKNMLFFDDEYRNIEEVSMLGVECVFVPDGITWKLVHAGLELLRNRLA